MDQQFIDHATAFLRAQHIPNHEDEYVCSYLSWEDGEYTYNEQDICHASASYGLLPGNHGGTSIWTYNQWTKLYVDWLLDPKKSPWRKVLKHGQVVYLKDSDTPCGFILKVPPTDECSCEAIVNFYIALRWHTEHTTLFSVWRYLVDKKKMNKAQAFYLAENYRQPVKEKTGYPKDAQFYELPSKTYHYQVMAQRHNVLPSTSNRVSPKMFDEGRLRKGPLNMYSSVWKAPVGGRELNVLKCIGDMVKKNDKTRYQGVFPSAAEYAQRRNLVNFNLRFEGKQVQLTLDDLAINPERWYNYGK